MRLKFGPFKKIFSNSSKLASSFSKQTSSTNFSKNTVNINTNRHFSEFNETTKDAFKKDKSPTLETIGAHEQLEKGSLSSFLYHIDKDPFIDINEVDKNGDTVLHRIASTGHLDEETLEILIARGANIFKRNHNGELPIAVSLNPLAFRPYEAELEKADPQKRNIAHYVAMKGSASYIKLAFKKLDKSFWTRQDKYFWTKKDNYGNTPLHYFLKSSHFQNASDKDEDVRFVIHALMNDDMNAFGEAPIHCAIKAGRSKALEAFPIGLNGECYTPRNFLNPVLNEGLPGVIRAGVFEHTIDLNLQSKLGDDLIEYAIKNRVDYRELLKIVKTDEKDYRSYNGENLLHFAAKHGNNNIVRTTDPNLNQPDLRYMFPIEHALRNGHFDTVKEFLNVHYRNNPEGLLETDFLNVLDEMCRYSDLKEKAPELRNLYNEITGETPATPKTYNILHFAAKHGKAAVVRTADPSLNVRDNRNNMFPIEYALRNGHFDTVKEFLNYHYRNNPEGLLETSFLKILDEISCFPALLRYPDLRKKAPELRDLYNEITKLPEAQVSVPEAKNQTKMNELD